MQIKNMDIVTLKNGKKYFYVEHPLFGKMFLNESGHLPFSNYDKNYRVKRDLYNYPWDIPTDVKKIERTCSPNCIFDINNTVTMTVWDSDIDFSLPEGLKEFVSLYPTAEEYRKRKGFERSAS